MRMQQRLQTDILQPRGGQVIRLNISRNLLLAIIFSLALHAFLLWFFVPDLLSDQASAPPPRALEVSLAPPAPAQEAAPVVSVPEITPEIPIEKPAEKPKRKVMTKKAKAGEKPIFSVPTEMTETEMIENVPDKPEKRQPEINEPPPKAEPAEDAPTDMASYIKAQQAKRLAAGDAAQQNAEAIAREQGPTAAQKRDAIIKNNFKNGTNGIFEVTSLSTSSGHATFSFKGWTNDFSNAQREFFEVEARSNQDVRLVMVKKMISLIRQHYQGDFNWESQRLGRTIVQSARLEDNAGLEDFLMMEFFGTHYKTQL